MVTVALTNNSPATGDAAGADDTPDNPPEPGGLSRHEGRAGHPSTNPVEFIWAAPGACAVDLTWLEAMLAAVCAEVGRPVSRLTVRIVGDAEMARLHEAHAGVSGTTDVLTFDSSAERGGIDVDIAVCVDEAVRQARVLGHAVERELLLYAVHGLLHCLGFDDHTDADFERMHAEEDRLLEAVGVEPTFAPRRDRSASKTE